MAIISAGFIMLQAFNPKAAGVVAAKITGTDHALAAGDTRSLWQRIFESERKQYSWEPSGSGESRLGNWMHQSMASGNKSASEGSRSNAGSAMRQRYGSLTSASPVFSGEGGAGLLAINSISAGNYRPPQPAAKAKASTPKATNARAIEPAFRQAKTPVSGLAEKATRAASRKVQKTQDRSAFREQPGPEMETADNDRNGAQDAAAAESVFSQSKQDSEARKDDYVLASSIITRAATDIRLTPHAVSAVKDFAHSYPGTPQARDLQGRIDALTKAQGPELYERSTIGQSTRLAPLLLSDDEQNAIRTCLAATGFVNAVNVASIVLKRHSALPAYAVAVDIKADSIVGMFGAGLTPAKSSNDKRMVAVSRCLKSLFSRGTVAFLFSGTSTHAAGIRRIRAIDNSRLFWKGFAESSGSRMRRG